MRKTWIATSAVAVILFGAALTADASKPVKGEVTVTGMVKRARISSSGEVKRVYIDDESRGAILVGRPGKGRELLGHVKTRVQATGFLKRTWDDKNFDYVMDVDGFKVLPESSEVNEDDEKSEE